MNFSHLSKAVSIFALAVAAVASPARAADKITVVLDFPYPVTTHTGLRLAEVKGWYKEAGLDVDIQMGKGSVVTIQQVAAGQADIGEINLSALVPAISQQNLPVISIMAMSQESDLGVTVGKDLNYKTPKDLKGMKLVAPSSGAANALLPSFLQKAGLKKDDVTVTYVDSTGLLGAFTSKSADGVVAGITYALPRVEDKRAGVPVWFTDVGLNVPGYGLITNKNLIDSKADALRKMVQINQRSWQYIKDGHEQEGIDALVKTGEQFRPDPKILLSELKLLLKLFETPNTKGHALGWQSDKDWSDSLTVMQSVDSAKPGWKTSDYFDNRFIADKK